MNTRALTSAALAGVLQAQLGTVNMVSAPIAARERGIKVDEVKLGLTDLRAPEIAARVDRGAVDPVIIDVGVDDRDGRLDRSGVAVEADDVDGARRIHPRGPQLLAAVAAGRGVEAPLGPCHRSLTDVVHRRVPGDALLDPPRQEVGPLRRLDPGRAVALRAALRERGELRDPAVAVRNRDIAREVHGRPRRVPLTVRPHEVAPHLLERHGVDLRHPEPASEPRSQPRQLGCALPNRGSERFWRPVTSRGNAGCSERLERGWRRRAGRKGTSVATEQRAQPLGDHADHTCQSACGRGCSSRNHTRIGASPAWRRYRRVPQYT